MAYTLSINSAQQTVDVDGDTPLLWVLRDVLKLTGTKFGCGVAQCGACTVQVDGNTVRSCTISIARAAGRSVTTIEAIAGKEAEAIHKAWIAHDVPQCGYCQSGQIMSAVALLQAVPKPTDDDIDKAMTGNICRCATYVRIRAAIHTAAESLGG